MNFLTHDFFGIHRKFLVSNLVLRNLKIRYRDSFFGLLWTLLIPAFLAGIYYMVFQYFMKFNIPNYLLHLIAGMLPWTFFSGTLTGGVESIVSNGALIKKVPIPPFLFAYVEAITFFINFVLSLPVLLALMLFYGASFSWSMLWLPYLFGLLFLQAYAYALILGVYFVYLRDLKPFLGILLQAWFYVTPILYVSDFIPENMTWVLKINSVAYIIMNITNIFTHQSIISTDQMLFATVVTLVLTLVSFYIYNRNFKKLAQNV